jgi:beta-phosphoglucomutase-like phosphatase (HAD superfamily)
MEVRDSITLNIPEAQFKAYLFDCDGTIVDSMPLHFKAWCEALGEWNVPFSEERFYGWGGMSVSEIIAKLAQEHGVKLCVNTVASRREALFFEHLPELLPVPGVVEHIEAQHGRIPFAVVSGSTRESVTKCLNAVGLLDRFETLVCAGDYNRGKPDPEPFLVAAKRLGVDPQSCLVFEDTQMGIDAARAAGMAWVRVPSEPSASGGC